MMVEICSLSFALCEKRYPARTAVFCELWPAPFLSTCLMPFLCA